MADTTDDQIKAVRATMIERGVASGAQPFGLVLDAEEEGRPDLPRVQLPLDGWQLSRFAREVGSVLQGRGVFRWKDAIVTISEETGERELMDSHRFRSFVERYMQTFRLFFSQKAGTIEIPQTMAVEHAQGCLRADEFTRRQPRLVRIHSVRLPILRDDGRVELLPVGYDAESGIYTLPMGFDYDEKMTLEEGAFIMRDLHREFPFADRKDDGNSRSQAVHMANFLSQFGYMLLPRESRRLNFLYNANAPRSGKTLLVELILNTVHGRAAIDNMPDDRNKLRDRLDTAVLSGATHLVFDDLEGFLRNGLLNSFLTAPTWSGRKFHTQDEFIAEKSPVVMLTGNNVEMTPDVAGRTLTCDLYREEADDQAQRIEKPIDGDYVKSKGVRAQLLSALWAIVKAWRDGRPHEASRVISGYQRWSSVFAPMVSLSGFGDPLEPAPEGAFGGNTEFADMCTLVSTLAEGVAKMREVEFQEIVSVCRETGCFEHLMEGKLVWVDGENEERWQEFQLSPSASSRLGKLLSGRYGGQRFMTRHGQIRFGSRGRNRHKRYVIEVCR